MVLSVMKLKSSVYDPYIRASISWVWYISHIVSTYVQRENHRHCSHGKLTLFEAPLSVYQALTNTTYGCIKLPSGKSCPTIWCIPFTLAGNGLPLYRLKFISPAAHHNHVAIVTSLPPSRHVIFTHVTVNAFHVGNRFTSKHINFLERFHRWSYSNKDFDIEIEANENEICFRKSHFVKIYTPYSVKSPGGIVSKYNIYVMLLPYLPCARLSPAAFSKLNPAPMAFMYILAFPI